MVFRSWSGMWRGRCGLNAVGRETEIAEGMLSWMGGGVGGEVIWDVGGQPWVICTETEHSHKNSRHFLSDVST